MIIKVAEPFQDEDTILKKYLIAKNLMYNKGVQE